MTRLPPGRRSKTIRAPAILSELLLHLTPIWPSRQMLAGVPLGDCWPHPLLRTQDTTDGLVPLHKLSQWLAYSLIEPLQWAGYAVTDVDGLTGLAEYRNGGLFVDTGVLTLRDPTAGDARARRGIALGGRMARADRRVARRAGRQSAPPAEFGCGGISARAASSGRHLGGRPVARWQAAPGRLAAHSCHQRRQCILRDYAGSTRCKESPSPTIR